ncbi:MAG: hypothetical protein WD716_05730 [Fimbriimonadaceae bacterium]
MSDLSEDRKRQIREEEERRVAKIKAEEEAYREQVRRELEGAPHPPPPMAPPVEPPPAAPPPTARQELPARAREPKPPRKPRPKKQRVILGSSLALVGAVLAYYAYYQGFPIPGIDGPFKSTLTAEATGELKPVDRAKWDNSAIAPGEWNLGGDGKIVVAATAPPLTERTGPERTTPGPPTGPDVPKEPGRVAIAGGKVSLVLPTNWTLDETAPYRVLAHRDFGDGRALRLNVTDVSDRVGDGLAALHAQNVQYVTDWVKPSGGFTVIDENTDEIVSGLTFSMTVLEDPNAPGYYYAALTTVTNGRAVWVIVDGPDETPDGVDDEIEALIASLRLSR